MSNETINIKIMEYLNTLDKKQYTNIFAMLEADDVTKSRLLDTIAIKLIEDKDCNIECVVQELEISFDLI
jgi:hypothetical protein